MNKFKVGDIVRVTNEICLPFVAKHFIKEKFKIVYVNDKEKTALLYHKDLPGHSAAASKSAKQDNEHNWWVSQRFLKLATDVDETIVIYRDKKDPNKVIALDKRTGNKAIARCNPADEFSFDKGAKLAFERLTKKEEVAPEPEKKPYNCKFVVLEADEADDLTPGKIYEMKDGFFLSDKGRAFPLKTPITSADEMHYYFLPMTARKKGSPGYSIYGVKYIEVTE